MDSNVALGFFSPGGLTIIIIIIIIKGLCILKTIVSNLHLRIEKFYPFQILPILVE